MEPRYQIRRAAPADAAAIAHHRRSMFSDMGLTDHLDAMEASFAAYAAEQIAQGAYLGWLVIDPEGGIVGGAGVQMFEWGAVPRVPHTHLRPYIMNVYVEPAHRRAGLARALLQAIIDWARAEGYGSITLHASEFGRPLYEQLGFTATNEMRLAL
ncbi:MAG: GNAT family N-acetyltransferase [bacterium]|nr:GNAT family N-acetyltransferase [bacterium]